MAMPDKTRFFAALDATWAPFARHQTGGWTVREGRSGGQRVSSATRDNPGADIADAETCHRELGQRPLFMLRDGEGDLDEALAARDYEVVDPVILYAAPTDRIADPGKPHTVISTDSPIALMREIWAGGGIGPGRLDVMARAPGPATTMMIRNGDRGAGCAFVACDGEVAMIHALEIAPQHRRQGLGLALTQAAAHWALQQGADIFSLAVTQANAPARAVYEKLGFTPVTEYHYRRSPG